MLNEEQWHGDKVHDIYYCTKEIIRAFHNFGEFNSSSKLRIQKMKRWKPPSESWVKLNTNSAFNVGNSMATVRGLS